MLRAHIVVISLAALAVAGGCATKKPPVNQPTTQVPAPSAFPGAAGSTTGGAAAPTERPPAPPPVPDSGSVSADPLANKTPEQINSDSPLRPVFFAFDSDELDDSARSALDGNAQVLKHYGTWMISIEGHCDERGTAEYNLALGDRRALAARNYLISLGIGGNRIRTVSYGKEFPFDPGHTEASWANNRRAQFMVTSK
ncbi:MAG TPA: OmpA family protein [Vicinamibacterales bacterium]|nr:OmpA family protein [Vicinamibacterales bacterium]